jgi:hypothetical protein
VRVDAPNALLRTSDAIYVNLADILSDAERHVRALAPAFGDAGVRTPALENGLLGICRAVLVAGDRLRAVADSRADELERLACLAWHGYTHGQPGIMGLRDSLPPCPLRPHVRLRSLHRAAPVGVWRPVPSVRGDQAIDSHPPWHEHSERTYPSDRANAVIECGLGEASSRGCPGSAGSPDGMLARNPRVPRSRPHHARGRDPDLRP